MRDLLDHGAPLVDALGGAPLDLISRMLRGSIVPRPGHEIAAGDYTSVEAVGVAWLAGQEDLLASFRRKEKIYEQMAGRVFRVDPADISPESPERFIGKTLVLGAGYQMGWRKFRETVVMLGGPLLSPEQAEHAITTYRETFGHIRQFWYDIEGAAIAAVQRPGVIASVAAGKIAFLFQGKWLRMRLPSGRYLWYSQPLLEPDERFKGQLKLTYMQVNPKTKKWSRGNTYGGRLCENAVQGLCRDLLVEATVALEFQGYRPIALVHDEIVCEPPIGHGSLDEQMWVMCDLPGWAAGFPLSAKGRRGERYNK
jgi:DNA polymerase